MDNQERNREALIEHIAEQDRIIRRRNDQISGLVERIEQAEVELAKYRAMHSEQIKTIARLQENPHPLTADDITEAGTSRFIYSVRDAGYDAVMRIPYGVLMDGMRAALTEPPPRPEGAVKVEAVLNQYWSGDIDGDDLADRAEEMQADLATAEEPEMDDEDRRLIADHLASMGYRKTGAEL